MPQSIILGLVTGGIYAVACSALSMTYQTTGILNFAFGGMAYFFARFYYFLHVQHSFSIISAAILCILVAGPCVGVSLWLVLFRLLQQASLLTRTVATIGLAVALPSLATIAFGNQDITLAPGLAPEPVAVYDIFGVPITLDEVLVITCVVAVLVLVTLILRYTSIGLAIRGHVDSPALTSLSGTDARPLAVGVWACSTLLASLAGILVAPLITLDPSDYTLLMVAAFAALVVASFQRLPVAIIVALAMGLLNGIIQGALPSASPWTYPLVSSLPFAFIFVFILILSITQGTSQRINPISNTLDSALKVISTELQDVLKRPEPRPLPTSSVLPGHERHAASLQQRWQLWLRRPPALLVVVAALAVVIAILNPLWLTLVALGLAFSTAFLSITLVTGAGGMIWLCQISLAGFGAVIAAQLVTTFHWPVISAILLGGAASMAIGAVIGLLTNRLDSLFIPLITITIAILFDQLVFNFNVFNNGGLGIAFPRPAFAETDRAFAYFALIVFTVFGIIVLAISRSTTGMAISAVRSSARAASTLGISVAGVRILVCSLAGFIAGVGGSLIAMYSLAATTSSFTAEDGLVWIAVVVTLGVRPIYGALLAGIVYSVVPGIFENYLPTSLVDVPSALFGLGAILVAANPDGVIQLHLQQLRRLISRRRSGRSGDALLAADTVQVREAGLR